MKWIGHNTIIVYCFYYFTYHVFLQSLSLSLGLSQSCWTPLFFNMCASTTSMSLSVLVLLISGSYFSKLNIKEFWKITNWFQFFSSFKSIEKSSKKLLIFFNLFEFKLWIQKFEFFKIAFKKIEFIIIEFYFLEIKIVQL